jgi:hypothetical protein
MSRRHKEAAEKQAEATLKTSAVEQEKEQEQQRHEQLLARLEKPFSPPKPEPYISRAKVPGKDEEDNEVDGARKAIISASYILIEGPSLTGKTTFVNHCLAGQKGVVFVSLKDAKPLGSIIAELNNVESPLRATGDCSDTV